jgi:plasmid stability protein
MPRIVDADRVTAPLDADRAADPLDTDRLPGSADEVPRPRVRQDFSAYGSAQQATLGTGTQYVSFGAPGAEPEAAISIAPPIGQRSDDLPLRGRDKLLAELSAPGPRVRILHGLGGCGKTRLALEAAFLAQQDGAEAWWVSAADRGSLEAGMRALGRRLGASDAELAHGDAADTVWRRLSARQARWLLIIDNADDPPLLAGAGTSVADGQGWLRPVHAQAGMILVTTRDGRPASWAPWCGKHRLPALPDSDAAQMLSDYAGGYPALGTETDAAELASRLGGLPLAVKIAGSYLADAATTPAAYADPDQVRTYRQYKEALDTKNLATVFPAPNGTMTQDQARTLIGKTWDLTLDLLQARQMPEARPLLRLLSTFADAPIPHELLLHPSTLAASPILPSITGPRLWEILKTLDAFGLLDLASGKQSPPALPTARLHPLVRDTSHPLPTELLPFLELAAQLLEQAVSALTEQTSVPEYPQSWPAWQLLTPHSTTVFSSLTAKPGYPDDSAKSAAYAAQMAARYLATQGADAQAEPLYRDVLTVLLRVLGPDHPVTLTTRHCIAVGMSERGDHEAAENESRDILTAKLRALGPDHPDTLTTRAQIAVEMAARGNHEAAENEYRDVLTATLRALGPNHPDTLTTRHCIALEIAAHGNHEAAENEFRDILTAKLRALGPNHPDTLATRHEIARIMTARGNHEDAEAEFRDVLVAKLRVLGPDHSSTKATATWVDHLERRRNS